MNNDKILPVKISTRKKKHDLENALGNDIMRYIAELLTNADDSYRRLESNGQLLSNDNNIYLELLKDKRKNDNYAVSVTDNAEGMTIDRLKSVFLTYADDNAGGIASHARGIFGQGASDVLQAAAYDGLTAQIESIKDDKVSKLIYHMDDDLNPGVELIEMNIIGNQLRQYRDKVRIPNNGTKVTFGIPDRVRFNDRIRKDLPEMISKYPTFRYLLNQTNRKFIYIESDKQIELKSEQYQFDESKILCDEIFNFNFDGAKVDCNLKLYINENKKDDKTNILVIDENNTVYDNTMFDFQNNAAAQNVSGILFINGLYSICYNHINDKQHPDYILSDNRTGFDLKNPFYIALNKAVNPYIDRILEENGKDIKTTNLSNNKKFSAALKKLNKYLKQELKDEIGGGNGKGKIPPKSGIEFVRDSISITINKQYDLKLLINSDMVLPNQMIKIECLDDNIEFSPNFILYNQEEVNDGLVIKNVTIKGIKCTNDSSILKASIESRVATTAIDVISPEIHYPDNGMDFYPKDVALTADKTHFVNLYIDSNFVPLNSKINLVYDNGINGDSYVTFVENDIIDKNIGVIKIVIHDGTVDNSYYLKANYENITASIKINIIEASNNEPQNGGLISAIKLQPNDAYYQSYYNSKNHTIFINSKNPINIRIMGDMKDKNQDNPVFNSQQSKYLCDIISSQAATILVKDKDIKNGKINFDDFETAVEQVQAAIQEQKNKIYQEIFPEIMGLADKKEDEI